MNKSNHIHISKLDAAKRQMTVAIKLFVNNGDIVVIHTLTSAAFNVLNDLAKAQDIESIEESLIKRVKNKYKKEVRDKLHEARNFFKHADRDGDSVLKFDPRITDFIILDACEVYMKLTSESPALINAYTLWFFVNNPDLLEKGVFKDKVLRFNSRFNVYSRVDILEIASLLEQNQM